MSAVRSIAVIGGGWAGCAAAVALAERDLPVTLYEAGPVLGGRARRVLRDGWPIDNGQHLLLGAYTETLAMIARVQEGAAIAGALRRWPLALVPLAASGNTLALRVRPLPGRLGLLAGLLLARGLSWRERIANVTWFRGLERAGFARPAGETVAKMLAPLPPRVTTLLWEPLCIAALNTPAHAASAQVFAHVLRAAFAADPRACDLLIAATDLSQAFPEAAARFVGARGSQVRTGTRAQVVVAGRDGATLAVGGRSEGVAAAIVAVGPHQLPGAFASEALAAHPPLAAAIDALQELAYEPIVTVWLGYATAWSPPVPLLRLDDAPGQWVFDRPDLVARAPAGAVARMLAVVISASGPHVALTHAALVAAVDAQLRRLLPALPPPVWSQVIAEKRATYACTPNRVRPAETRIAPGVYLAGDYVDAEFPATLEAAVRSGIAAADAVAADWR